MTDSKSDPYIENLFQSINEKNAEIIRLRATSAAANQILRDMQACGTWDDATMRRVIENIGPLLSVRELKT